MTTWKYNNVLVKGEEKRRIIGICDEVIFIEGENYNYTQKEIVETLTKKAMPPESFGYGDENRTVDLMEINNLNNI